MRNTSLLILTVCLALAGCFPATKEALKKDGRADRFEVADGYQVVYRRLVPILRECYESVWFDRRAALRSDLYTDVRRAELVVEERAMLPPTRSLILMYELEALDEGHTLVAFYSGYPGSAMPPMFRQWATGEKKDCP